MKTVSATIIYSSHVTIEVDDDASMGTDSDLEEIKNQLIAEAEKGDIDKSSPIVHDCSISELID